jgi:hypothetical protein
MNAKAYLLALIVFVAAMPAAPRAEAGTVVIPAWSFARGNARVHADPGEYADAGPVVAGGPGRPWGWRVEYDVDIPVAAKYTLQVCYASAEARQVNVLLDGRRVGDACNGITFGAGQPGAPTWKSSGARWGKVVRRGGKMALSEGKHTITLARRQPLPHLVALRLETEAEFPKGWTPPGFKVRDLDAVPAAHRKAFGSALKLPPALTFPTTKAAGTLTIPAWTFDRGNARIYANPDKYAIGGPLAGDGPSFAKATEGKPGVVEVEYDIEFPAAGEYTLHVRYAATEARPTNVYLDGRRVGRTCTGLSFNTAAFVRHPDFAPSSKSTRSEGLYDYAKGALAKLSVTRGKHTVKLARRGPLPYLASLRFETGAAFPKDWKAPERKVDLSRVPPGDRGVFLPPDAVNTGGLRAAVEHAVQAYGARYPDGPAFLKRLAALEAKQGAVGEKGSPEELQQLEDALYALRREILLAHPLLDFDNLLFIKRPSNGYGHTYADQHARDLGGSLCVLSPVSPDGEVTPLVPELEGGAFDRFDLSYDAKKVVFAYKTKDKPFRIYEIDIDPVAGKRVPGSLRQLTFGGKAEAEALRCQVGGGGRRFHDMDPCYLPNGKILFVSTRAQRIVFCNPSTVTTLYLMDADGKNLHRLSESPVNETAPSIMPDGRVIYTRWEYVDKNLAHAQSLWAVRPDGSGVDHVYKNNTRWPAGMSSARAVPGSPQVVTSAGNHHFVAVGPVVLVDNRRTRRHTDAMTCVTPEIGYPPRYGYPANATRHGAFQDPFPFSEKYFLVSHTLGTPRGQRQGPYGLYMLDGWGNRAELYRDPKLSCFQPMPLRPRPRPMTVATVAAAEGFASAGKTAALFVQDVYRGMTGIERGRVKYVRVMGALEWPWDQNGISWSLGVDPHRKKIYGVAKVHEDGSAFFNVPARHNLFFQALDENFQALQEMATFVNLMPGETRGCIGCHEMRRYAPGVSARRPQALDHPARDLAPQPGDTGPRVVDFRVDVQSILDRHCMECHGGRKPKGRLDFFDVPVGKYSRSYNNLIGSGTVCFRGGGRAGIRATPPLTHGSAASRLPVMLREGHNKVKLSREELIRLVTWIDANIPYYGTYRGRIGAQDKDHPDFRALPLTMR